MMLYICMKFHENILKGFQLIEQTRLLDRQTTEAKILYMSMKFHKNILNSFQVREGTQNYHCQIYSKTNSKNVLTRVTVLVLRTSSDDDLYF